jgi:peptide/nickel transport system substrate-binding protein
MKRERCFSALFVTALLIALTSACGSAPQNTTTQSGGAATAAPQAANSAATLTVGFPREVTTLDSLYSTLRENDILSLLTDDALFYIDPETLEPVPLAAKSHTFVDDQTLEVELHQGIKFHDGSEMTADDVVYTYDWLINPASQTSFTSRIARWLESIEAVDPYKVRFNMKGPYAMVLYDLTYYSKIRKKDTYQNAEKEGGIDPTAMTTTLVSNGPYKVTEFKPGDQIVLERFADYRADSPKGQPSINTIVIRSIPDESTMAAEIMNGTVHWTYQVSTDIAEDVARTNRAQLVNGPTMRIGYIILDAMGRVNKDGPLTNVKVRQALNYATDRESITTNLVKGTSKPLFTACHPAQFGCAQDVPTYEYNPDKAKQLLAEAGYPDGFEMELWASREKAEVEAIIEQWRQVGVTVNLRFVKQGTINQAQEQGQVYAYYGSSGSYSIADAGAVGLDKFSADAEDNYSGDAAVAEAMAAAVATYDPEERLAAYKEALTMIAEQAYWVPTHTYTLNYLVADNLAFTPPNDGMPRLFLFAWE